MKRSGGFFYHLRAFRFLDPLWKSHQAQVKSFLEAWNPKGDELLLFGPSAGYSLPARFVKRFKTIIAVEPDPIARFLFEKRFRVHPKWIKKEIRFDRNQDLLQFAHFKGAILFCNLLGQITMKSAKPVRTVLATFLEHKHWASFHDAMSGNEIEFDCEDAGPKKATLAEMKSWVYVKNPKANQVEVTAHLAPDLFNASKNLRFRYWLWTITENQSNLIEGVYRED